MRSKRSIVYSLSGRSVQRLRVILLPPLRCHTSQKSNLCSDHPEILKPCFGWEISYKFFLIFLFSCSWYFYSIAPGTSIQLLLILPYNYFVHYSSFNPDTYIQFLLILRIITSYTSLQLLLILLFSSSWCFCIITSYTSVQLLLILPFNCSWYFCIITSYTSLQLLLILLFNCSWYFCITTSDISVQLFLTILFSFSRHFLYYGYRYFPFITSSLTTLR